MISIEDMLGGRLPVSVYFCSGTTGPSFSDVMFPLAIYNVFHLPTSSIRSSLYTLLRIGCDFYNRHSQLQSAILAAIQICLGAGARRTHRATNLKELVRKEAGSNCNGAKVRVTVLNRGDDGYQHDVYGDSITIERSISLRGGYNGYKLLDHNGVEKSRNKKDLDAMLDQLNIQVENPVAVLDQEEAKKFLCGKPEDKYNFFTKATELERMDRAYANLSDNIADMSEAASRIRETLAPKEQTVKALKHEYDQFKELDKLEAKVGELRVTAVWAKRNEMQEKADGAQEVSQWRFFSLAIFDSRELPSFVDGEDLCSFVLICSTF